MCDEVNSAVVESTEVNSADVNSAEVESTEVIIALILLHPTSVILNSSSLLLQYSG